MESDDNLLAVLDEETFQKFPEGLLCDICTMPSTNWKQSCRYQHSYCNECISAHISRCQSNNTRPFCPSCKDPIVFIPGSSELQSDRARNSITDEQQVDCPNGCGHTTLLGKVVAHIKKECPNAVVKCQMHAFGCTHTCKRNELAKHMEEDDHSRFAIPFVMGQVKTFKSETLALKEEIQKLSGVVSSIVDVVGALKTDLAAHMEKQVQMNIDVGKLKEKLFDCMYDDECGLQKIAEQTKKRAAKGAPSDNPRTVRGRKQVQKQKEELEKMEKELAAARQQVSDAQQASSSNAFLSASSSAAAELFDEAAGTSAAPAAAAAAAAAAVSPAYSPTSPAYSPTSPQYDPTFVAEEVDEEELEAPAPAPKRRKKRTPIDDEDDDEEEEEEEEEEVANA